MSRDHVDHGDIARFADSRVNLKRDDASELRAQANRLREKVEGYLADHPDFGLKKMLLAGSLAKGTALKSISDIDVACYVASQSAPHSIGDLISWLAERLETAFAGFKPSQITRKTYSVSVQFIATGNEVDIVPILYSGDPQWRGDLISQDTGERLTTSVPMHLDFIRKRKAANPQHFAQVVRLIKFWAGLRKRQDTSGNFRFKSFMIELIVAYLADRGVALNDYPEALQSFFTFLATDQLRSIVSFTDYYPAETCTGTSDPIRIWDPVNCENNVAKLYNSTNRELIVEAAIDTGDAIDGALRAISKGETIRYWQKVFGPSFDV
jgi:predicted nucleotidyltransferase